MSKRITLTDAEIDYIGGLLFDECPRWISREDRSTRESVLRKIGWQDESRTKVEFEKVYDTRIDATPARREAA